MTNVTYITIDEVVAIHTKMIELYGGRMPIHDLTLLHSAVERPKVTFAGRDLYPDLFSKAAALIQSLILNHPFDDGNNRTSISSCARFLRLNNYKLVLDEKESIQFTLDIDSHKLSFQDTAVWLKNHSRKIEE